MALNTGQQYSPGDLAQYTGGDTWDQKEFFYNGKKYAVRDNGNGTRRVEERTPTPNDIRSGNASGGNTKQILVNEISQQLIELEDKLAQIPNVSFTQQEKDAFMQKAITDITPWYEKTKADIEKGIKEGKIRTAEDTLALVARVKMDVKNSFQKYDIEEAQTEEEFTQKLAEITSDSEEAVETKKYEWTQRLNDAKLGLEKSGIYSSGIGQKKLADLQARQEAEKAALERRTEVAKQQQETVKKFSLDRVAIARQAITDDRKRRIGDPVTTAQLETGAKAELGLGADQEIGSEADLAYQREQRNTKVYDPTALDALEEDKYSRQASKFQTIQTEEKDARESEYESQRKVLLAQQAKKQLELNSYR